MDGNKTLYFCITTALSLFVPAPGRFVFAFYLLLLFNLQIFLLTLLFHGVDRLRIGALKEPVAIFSVVFLTVLYKQLLYAVCPLAALTLGFCAYLPSISVYTLTFFFGRREGGLAARLSGNMRACAVVSAVCAVLFLLRDLLGYGTLTLPGWRRIVYLRLPFAPGRAHAGAFLSTIPGALVFLSVLLAAFLFCRRKLDAVARAGGGL